jgi:predicted alpha/beta-fold hydrolase
MSNFKSPFFMKNRHFQTIFPALFTKVSNLDLKYEIFELSDGDFLECAWCDKLDPKSDKDIVVLFHGLAGGVDSAYIKRVMKQLQDDGKSSVLMHFRGCGKTPNRKARSYHSGESGDAREWIAYLKTNYPNSDLSAIGYSLGGNMLLKLLGEYGENSPLKSAIAVSVPLDLAICADEINKGISKIYQKHLLKALKRDLKRKYDKHDMQKLIGKSRSEIDDISSFWQFDDIYTSIIHGFKDAKDYYKRCSAKQFLKDIKTKTLIIHSKDDPFMSEKVLPKDDEISDFVELEIYEDGGHVGFVSGNIFKPKFWLEDRICKFLKTL